MGAGSRSIARPRPRRFPGSSGTSQFGSLEVSVWNCGIERKPCRKAAPLDNQSYPLPFLDGLDIRGRFVQAAAGPASSQAKPRVAGALATAHASDTQRLRRDFQSPRAEGFNSW